MLAHTETLSIDCIVIGTSLFLKGCFLLRHVALCHRRVALVATIIAICGLTGHHDSRLLLHILRLNARLVGVESLGAVVTADPTIETLLVPFN